MDELVISHRGNLIGSDHKRENTLSAIKECIQFGFSVEIDIFRMGNNLYLGHDSVQEKIGLDFLSLWSSKLWIHCKNLCALDYLTQYEELKTFWIQNDAYSLISDGTIWTHHGQITTDKCILMIVEKPTKFSIPDKYLGLCSDYPIELRSLLNAN